MNLCQKGMNQFQNGMKLFQTGMKTFRIGMEIWGNQNYKKIKLFQGLKIFNYFFTGTFSKDFFSQRAVN